MDKPADIALRLLAEHKWSREWATRAAQALALPAKTLELVKAWIHLNPYSTP